MIRDPRRELHRRRRAAAERLRREVQHLDGSLTHPYFRKLRSHVRSYRRETDLESLFAACSRSRVVFVGDFHAVSTYPRFAARVLEELCGRSRRVGLGVEFVYTRQQPWLDARQRGDLGDAEFLRRIHYREEWGYPWDGYRDVLDAARGVCAPVFALDASPRAGLDGIRSRDDHAARRIVSILEADRDLRLVVLFGESHLAPAHLPGKVARTCARHGMRDRSVIVLQNPDEIYWDVVRDRKEMPQAVRIDDTSWAVFHTSPLQKYEAYRQVLERWSEDVPEEDEVDLTPAVHHLIEVLLGWLGIRARRRIRHRAGWIEELSDAFPEVYSGREASELLAPILREHGRSPEEVREARALLRKRGALYESRSNVVFLRTYRPGRAAGEAARFLRAALTGRLFIAPRTSAEDAAVRAYGAAYNEAIAYLGSRLVDPASEYLSRDDLSALRRRRSDRPAGPELGRRIRWMREHVRFERGGEARPPEALMAALRGSRRRARTLARDLGHRLGRVLFERVRAGEVARSTLRSWFTRPLPPHRAVQTVVALLRGQ